MCSRFARGSADHYGRGSAIRQLRGSPFLRDGDRGSAILARLQERLDGRTGQRLGRSLPRRDRLDAGFLAFAGAHDVPIVLRLGKREADGAVVELFWSGQAPQFKLFRAGTPTDVTAPGNLLRTTTDCEQWDTDPSLFDLVFYKVKS